MTSRIFKIISSGGLKNAVNSEIVDIIKNENDFNELIAYLDHDERHVRMHAVDGVEKLTIVNPGWLKPHKKFLMDMMEKYDEKEFRWHIAQIISRLKFNEAEAGKVWDLLSSWLNNKKESRIVRVFSLQALYDISKSYPELRDDLVQSASEAKQENIPSLNSRIRKLGL